MKCRNCGKKMIKRLLTYSEKKILRFLRRNTHKWWETQELGKKVKLSYQTTRKCLNILSLNGLIKEDTFTQKGTKYSQQKTFRIYFGKDVLDDIIKD